MKRLMELLKKNELVNQFIREYGQQAKKIAVLAVAVIVLFGVYALKNGDGADMPEDVKQVDAAPSRQTQTDTIFVDIGGSVDSPMLAELPEGSRVEDAIKAAGGLQEDADLSSINRAEFLKDGDKIFIPCYERDEEGQIVTSSENDAYEATGKVNINTADSTALQVLNGVGPATAQKIIDYRNSNGNFSSIEDIKNVSGIGDKTFEKIKDSITT